MNNNLLQTTDTDWYKQRLAALLLGMVAVFILLFGRLFYLQAIHGGEYRRLSENNCIRLQGMEAPRGLIYDRHGTLLVDNRPSYDLKIIPKDAVPIENTISMLSSHLQTSLGNLTKEIKKRRQISPYKPVSIKEDIERDLLAAVAVHKFELPGVIVDVKARREYIHRNSAAHIIGYLGEINQQELDSGRYLNVKRGDFIGKFGIEKAYDEFLRGRRGGRQVEVDAAGQVVSVLRTVQPQPGYNVFLTIDIELQQVAEALLEGVAGAVVAMRPDSGEILVMASSPTFDQNAFVSGMPKKVWSSLISNPFRPLENKAIQGEYPPASTYKIITAMAGLEERVITPATTFFCPGHFRYGDRTFRCWKKGGHGKMNVFQALEQSCDVFFYQVGQKLGVDRLAWYAKSAGLGQASGIELDREAQGLIPTASWKKQRTGVPWMGGETLSIAIGQGYNLVTPLQLLGMISAVATGGIRYKPIILDRIETAPGQIFYKATAPVGGKMAVSAPTLNIVKKGLQEAVNGKRGTARGARLKNVQICGKTGTAQVFSRKSASGRKQTVRPLYLKDHAWFVAYAPAKNPQIAVAVIIEHGEHGSSAAAPIASEIIKAYLTPQESDGRMVAQRP